MRHSIDKMTLEIGRMVREYTDKHELTASLAEYCRSQCLEHVRAALKADRIPDNPVKTD